MEAMDDLVVVEAERRTLLALAYRLLGTVADAEDAVQETYVRWVRLTDAERAGIVNPGAWLTRVAGRICLDALGSARARRESYVGQWLPEPVPQDSLFVTPSPDPLDRVSLDESVGMALLVLLESLTPPERVAFVLHDVFGVPFAEIAETVGRSTDAVRQLASQGRRRVRERRARLATREQHDAVARAFLEAAATGRLDRLITVLDPDVVLISDAGGRKSVALRRSSGPIAWHVSCRASLGSTPARRSSSSPPRTGWPRLPRSTAAPMRCSPSSSRASGSPRCSPCATPTSSRSGPENR